MAAEYPKAQLWRSPEVLVWLQTAFIGDVVLTSAAIALVHKSRPEIKQYVVTTAAGREILADCPGVHEVLVLEKRRASFIAAFRQVKRALVAQGVRPHRTLTLQVHRSLRSSLLAAYLGYPTVTYQESSGAWLAARRVPRIALLHETSRIALLLEPLGFTRAELLSCRPVLHKLTPAPGSKIDGLVQLKLAERGKHLVAIAPGSVWGTKRWLGEYYSQLLQMLVTRADIAVVLLGSPGELPLVQEILAALTPEQRGSNLFNLCGLTSISELKALFPHLSLLICGDSSPLHFASAFNTPTLAIFGATVPAMGFAPLADKQEIVEHSAMPCRPCSDHGPQRCPLVHFRCMRELSVGRVYAAVERLIGHRP
jgi:heptosyltransferase-2